MFLIIYLIYLATISIVTFIFYGVDKANAKRGGQRVPEKILLTLSFVGGALGGIFGMNILRHKTKHWYFTAVNIIGIIIHALIAIFLSTLI